HAGSAAHVVTVEENREFAFRTIFYTFDNSVAVERRHDSRGLLERHQTRPDLDQLLGVLHPFLQSMNRAHGVVDFDVSLAAELFYGLGRGLDVSKIISRLENAKNVHAIGDGSLDKLPNDFVGVGAVGQNMLAAQKHLQFRFGHHRLDAPQPIPWIFFKVTHAYVERRTSPNLHGVKTTIVDGRAQR